MTKADRIRSLRAQGLGLREIAIRIFETDTPTHSNVCYVRNITGNHNERRKNRYATDPEYRKLCNQRSLSSYNERLATPEGRKSILESKNATEGVSL